MEQDPATTGNDAGATSSPSLTLARIEADREQLTYQLRSLAAELDELDRQLSDLSWHARDRSDNVGDPTERAALASRHQRLNTRLGDLVGQLENLDRTLANVKGRGEPAVPAGACPHCGHRSLRSGLCAYCRPMRAG